MFAAMEIQYIFAAALKGKEQRPKTDKANALKNILLFFFKSIAG